MISQKRLFELKKTTYPVIYNSVVNFHINIFTYTQIYIFTKANLKKETKAKSKHYSKTRFQLDNEFRKQFSSN